MISRFLVIFTASAASISNSMSDLIAPTLGTIPPELLHRIFDFLDASTILFHIRPVSRWLRSVSMTYARYQLDSKLVSKRQFKTMCLVIPPDHILSLRLSNGNDSLPVLPNLLASMVDHPPFTRLRVLNLSDINEHQMHQILARVSYHCLESFSLPVRSYNNDYV